jgi:chaperonin GroEL
MKTSHTRTIKKTFQKIADMVTPTMGAKGRMAIINDEFGRPILTDDGVTVAKECLHLEGFERMLAIAMVEASSNTEKVAYDGTTLTVLMTNELYKQGLRWVRRGMHPQQAADKLLVDVEQVRIALEHYKFKPNKAQVKQLATITTKIPLIGDLVAQAYSKCGDSMNVIIEHDRKENKHSIEHTDGMILDAGYFTKELGQLCNEGDKTIFKDAHLVLLSEGQLTQIDLANFFRSIPDENIKDPFVFFVTNAFNPESMKMLLDTLISNKIMFQMVFINDSNPEEIYLDLAAKTDGCIQSSAIGTSEYKFKDCGLADSITIEADKTTIIRKTKDKKALQHRIDSYKKELKDKKYTLGSIRENQITRRLSNLESGVTKIKIAVPTITEYMTIKLKLDDAIGAVKCALKNGILIGGGKTLYNLSNMFDSLRKPLRAPMKTIIKNSGLQVRNKKAIKKYANYGVDVKTGETCNLLERGIIDSFDSIDKALENAVSIAANYLRGYIIIKKD